MDKNTTPKLKNNIRKQDIITRTRESSISCPSGYGVLRGNRYIPIDEFYKIYKKLIND